MKKIAFLILTPIILLLVLVNFSNINFVKPYIIDFSNETLDRQVQLNGDIQLKFFPTIKLIVNDVKFSNAKWSTSEYLLELKYIHVELSALSLLTGDVLISGLEADGVKIYLERNAENKANWEFDALSQSEKPSDSSESAALEIPFGSSGEILLTDIWVTYQEPGKFEEAIIKKMSLKEDASSKWMLDASYNKIPVNVKLETELLRNIFDDNNLSLNTNGKLGSLTFSLMADIALDKILVGNLGVKFDAKVEDLSIIKTLTDSGFPDPGAISVKGKATYENGLFSLDLDSGVIGKTQLSGTVKYDQAGARPKVESKLIVTSLDLNVLGKKTAIESDENNPSNKSSNKSKNKSKKEGTEIFSNAPLPLKLLKEFDLVLDININNIEHRLLSLDVIELQATLDGGLFDVDKLYVSNKRNEKLNLQASIDAREEIAKMKISLSTENLQLDKNETLKKYLTGATTNFELQLDSQGVSIKDLMAQLNGRIVVQVGEGKIDDSLLKFVGSNILTDLVKAINPLADENENTSMNLECAAVRLEIKDGIVTVDRSIAMETSEVQIISSGEIDLRKETLEFAIKPQAREGVELNLNSFASMVKLSGKIDKPTISMSLKDTAVVYSYFATGGVTFLAKSLFDTATRDESPCETAAQGLVPGAKPKKSNAKSKKAAKLRDREKEIEQVDEIFSEFEH